jgi:deoxyribonuclease-4
VRIGAHESIAGGLERAIDAARVDGCEAVQIFTRNQSQWKTKPLTGEAIERWRAAVKEWGVPREHLMVHDSYLINLAAPDRNLRKKSINTFVDELERCAKLGIPYLVMHPGAHVGTGEAKGLERVTDGITRALDRTADDPEPATVLIELTAGQGTCLGHRFEHVRDLLDGIETKTRVGVCVDTCHVFAAGYDISTDEGYEATFKEMDRVFGLEHVRAFHLNDAKKPLGSRVDRHELIGEGHIGRLAFRRLMNDRRFADLPGILELPPPCSSMLNRLRRMADGEATSRKRPPAPRRTLETRRPRGRA